MASTRGGPFGGSAVGTEFTTRVEGLGDLNRALRRADKDVRAGVRKELRGIAEPIQRTAETLAFSSIRNIGRDWSRMRIGATLDLVYVAPQMRGTKTKARKRSNLADLLMDRAMQPALDQHAPEIERRVGDALDRAADNFSR